MFGKPEQMSNDKMMAEGEINIYHERNLLCGIFHSLNFGQTKFSDCSFGEQASSLKADCLREIRAKDEN